MLIRWCSIGLDLNEYPMPISTLSVRQLYIRLQNGQEHIFCAFSAQNASDGSSFTFLLSNTMKKVGTKVQNAKLLGQIPELVGHLSQ